MSNRGRYSMDGYYYDDGMFRDSRIEWKVCRQMGFEDDGYMVKYV